MNEDKEIIVAMTGTVTISTEDFVALQRRSALLDMIICKAKEKNTYSSDVTNLVLLADQLLNPVITDEADDSDGEPDA